MDLVFVFRRSLRRGVVDLEEFATFDLEAKIRLERDGTTESSAKTPLVIDVLRTTRVLCNSENFSQQVAKGERPEMGR